MLGSIYLLKSLNILHRKIYIEYYFELPFLKFGDVL